MGSASPRFVNVSCGKKLSQDVRLDVELAALVSSGDNFVLPVVISQCQYISFYATTSITYPAASYILTETGIVAVSLAPIVATLAPVVERIQTAPTFQTAPVTVTVTGIDMNRDGTPDVLQQPLCSATSLHVSVWMPLSARTWNRCDVWN